MSTRDQIFELYDWVVDEGSYPNTIKRDFNLPVYCNIPTELEFYFIREHCYTTLSPHDSRQCFFEFYPQFTELCDKIPNFWENL
ncbi:MAG: hypothetical protein ACHQ1D_00640 [Nitrososphaerales archaeon]